MRNGRNEILVNFSLSTLCAPFGQMKSVVTRYSLNTCHCRPFGHISNVHTRKWVIRHSVLGIFKIWPEKNVRAMAWAIDSNSIYAFRTVVALYCWQQHMHYYLLAHCTRTEKKNSVSARALVYGPLICLSTGMKLSEQNLWPCLFIYAEAIAHSLNAKTKHLCFPIALRTMCAVCCVCRLMRNDLSLGTWNLELLS